MSLKALVPLVLVVLAGTAFAVSGYLESRRPPALPAYDGLDLGAEFGPVHAAPGVLERILPQVAREQDENAVPEEPTASHTAPRVETVARRS